MKSKNNVYQGLSTLEVLEGADNYNKWIADSMRKHLVSPVIEFGAGTGNISDLILDKKDLTVTEVDQTLVDFLKAKYKDKNVKIFRLDLAGKIPRHIFSTYKSAFAVNVFEHIEDDVDALENVHKILSKNGRLVLLVPAKKVAYTKLDKNLGHYRRYEPEELQQKLLKSGYVVESIRYFNTLGLLSWIVRDKIEKQHRKLDKSHIELFDKIVPFLRKAEGVVPAFIGISLIAVARKR